MRAKDSIVGLHPRQLGVIVGSQVGVHHTHRHTVDLEPGPLEILGLRAWSWGVHHTHRHTVDLEPGALEIRVMGVVMGSQVGVHHTHQHTVNLEPGALEILGLWAWSWGVHHTHRHTVDLEPGALKN